LSSLNRTTAPNNALVDQTKNRTLVGSIRQHAQHRQTDQEPIRSSAVGKAEHDLHCLALRAGQPTDSIE